jgi:IS30 family transposase
MAQEQFTMDDIILIEKYYHQEVKTPRIVEIMGKKQPVYDVINFFKDGGNSREFWKRRKENQSRCGRKKTQLPIEDEAHIENFLRDSWSLDVIANRYKVDGSLPFPVKASTLYRRAKEGLFDLDLLPMKGKRKPNGHTEKRGKQAFTRNIAERKKDYPNVQEEFGHLEGDTIVGAHHKSAVITLAERLTKIIITLKPTSRKASDVGQRMNDWLGNLPPNFFKSITFDCGKEFSDWKNLSNQNDISIYFCDPGTPSQRPLNENSNGVLRRDGLYKKMDFNQVSEEFIQSVAAKRNYIPRKSLGYQTPVEAFFKEMAKRENQTMDLASL